MRMQAGLLALEKAVEREILAFFTLLGAGEVPEDWRPEALPVRAGNTTADMATSKQEAQRDCTE